MSKMVDCPRCYGSPEFDEDGRAYACYFCFDAGQVDEAVVLAIEAAERDQAERFAPKALGIFVKATDLEDEYDSWQDDYVPPTDKPGRGLFTRLLPPGARPSPEPIEIEDIPF